MFFSCPCLDESHVLLGFVFVEWTWILQSALLRKNKPGKSETWVYLTSSRHNAGCVFSLSRIIKRLLLTRESFQYAYLWTIQSFFNECSICSTLTKGRKCAAIKFNKHKLNNRLATAAAAAAATKNHQPPTHLILLWVFVQVHETLKASKVRNKKIIHKPMNMGQSPEHNRAGVGLLQEVLQNLKLIIKEVQICSIDRAQVVQMGLAIHCLYAHWPKQKIYII